MDSYFFTFTAIQQRHISKQKGFVKVTAESKEAAISVINALYPLGYLASYSEDNFQPEPEELLLETITQIFR